MKYPSLDKAPVDWSSLKQILPFGGNKGLTQSTFLNKAQTVHSGPILTPIETALNKSNHLVVKRVNTEHIACNFKSIDYVTANQPKFKVNHYKQKQKQLYLPE